jgi:hypothetical protein
MEMFALVEPVPIAATRTLVPRHVTRISPVDCHFGYSACLLQARDLVQIGKLLAIVNYVPLFFLLCLLLGGTISNRDLLV